MLQRLLALTALVGAATAVSNSVHVHVRYHHREAATEAPASSTDNSDAVDTSEEGSSAGEADAAWGFTPVRSIQARVQGNAPEWDEATKTFVASFGKTYDQKFRAVLDTVNTASVEGALMYVQAEGINVKEQSVKCERKNKMQYVVFYDITVAQPNATVAYYGGKHTTPEYGPYVAMDGGKCTPAGDDISDACKQYDGVDGQPELGHYVGAGEQVSDKRAPYPGNYWFSFPNSCVTKGWSNKTDECREEFPGGLCAPGEKPDGVKCTFTYKILGYLNIDDLVGITDGSGTPDKKAYANYTEFCNAGGVEFSAENTGQGFKVEQSIDFWKNPGDEQANVERTTKMIDMYNELAEDAGMEVLPEIDALVGENPSCYENAPECASAPHGCRRVLYSQVCQVCEKAADDCVVAPEGFEFPELEAPEGEEEESESGDGSSGSGSVGGGNVTTPAPAPGSAVSNAVASVAVVAASLVAAALL